MTNLIAMDITPALPIAKGLSDGSERMATYFFILIALAVMLWFTRFAFQQINFLVQELLKNNTKLTSVVETNTAALATFQQQLRVLEDHGKEVRAQSAATEATLGKTNLLYEQATAMMRGRPHSAS